MSSPMTDEMAILKAVSIKIDDKHTLIHTFQYHTEPKEAGVSRDKTKSKYRWLARVELNKNIEKRISELNDDSVSMSQKWKWTDDPSWTGSICYNNDSHCAAGAKWLKLRMRKSVDWDLGMKLLDGYCKGGKNAGSFNANAAYRTKLLDKSGNEIDLKDKTALLAHVGENLFADQLLKTV